MSSIGINAPGLRPPERTVLNNAEVDRREASAVTPAQADRIAAGRAEAGGFILAMQGRSRLAQLAQAQRERSPQAEHPHATTALAGLFTG
ncbi:hypothetical protein D9M70_575150 [compost metagenome]